MGEGKSDTYPQALGDETEGLRRRDVHAERRLFPGMFKMMHSHGDEQLEI